MAAIAHYSISKIRLALLLLVSLIPCALLVFGVLGPYEQGFSYKKVYGNDGVINLEPAWEAVLPVESPPPLVAQIDVTIYCKQGPCGRLVIKSEQGGDWPRPWAGDAAAAYFRLKSHGGAIHGLLVRNLSGQKIQIGEYRLKDYVANNSNLPTFIVSLHPKKQDYSPGVKAGLFLVMALLQLASLWVVLRRYMGMRLVLSLLLVVLPAWLAIAAYKILQSHKLYLTLAPDSLIILACVGGVSVSAAAWGPGIIRGFLGVAKQAMLAPVPAKSRPLLDKKVAPVIYAMLGLYLGYVSIFSLVPGNKAPEWTVTPWTWLIFSAVLAALLLAWRLGLRQLVAVLSDRLPLWPIITCGFLLRLAWALFSQVKQPSDWRQFCQMAVEIFNGAYLINPAKPAGPSLMAAGVYQLIGEPWVVMALVPVALASCLEILLVYSIARRYFGTRAARISALVLTFWPAHILSVNLMGSDTYFSFFVLMAMWLWAGLGQRPRDLLWAALAGLSLGAAHWMRPTTPFFVLSLLSLTALLWCKRPLKLTLLACGLFLGMSILVMPMIMLNQQRLGVSSALPAQLGNWSLLEGANQTTHGWYSMLDLRLMEQEAAARGWPAGTPRALRLDAVAREMAWQRISSDPWGYLQLCIFQKPLSLWGRVNHQRHSLATSVLGRWAVGIETYANYWHKIMLALAAMALLWGALRRSMPTGVFFAMTLAALVTSAAHTILEVQPRYHFMFIPWLCILVGSWSVMLARGEQEGREAANKPAGHN